MSKCGRYYAISRINEDVLSTNAQVRSKYPTLPDAFYPIAADIEVHDWTTDETICTIEKLFSPPQSLHVIGLHGLLVLQNSDGFSSVFELLTGKPVSSFPNSMSGFAIAPDGKRVLYADGRVAKLETFPGRLPLKTQEFEPEGQNWTAFFDENDRAKVYRLKKNEDCYTIGHEIWDLQSGQKEWSDEDVKYGRIEWYGSSSSTWTVTGTGTSLRFRFSSNSLPFRRAADWKVSCLDGDEYASRCPVISPSMRYCLYPIQLSYLPKRLRKLLNILAATAHIVLSGAVFVLFGHFFVPVSCGRLRIS